jgi:hypothetical protein
MVFEKSFENSYHDLPQSTKYRFAEIELSKALNTLTRFYKNEFNPREKASITLYSSITPKDLQTPEFEDRFFRTLSSTYFNQPNKIEIINYLLVKGHSYTKIRSLTSASFNTISKMRFGVPTHHPIFNLWDQEMLDNWNSIKENLNIWSESLAHMKE